MVGARVLLASDFYAPFIGGAERQTQLLGRELVRRGYEVSTATVWHAGLAEQQDDAGVALYRLKGLLTRAPWFFKDPSRRRYHPPFPDPGVVWGLRRLIGRIQPDLVHANGWIAYSCAAALLGRRIPLIVSVRDYGYTCAVRTLLRQGQVCDGPALAKCLGCARRTYGAPKALAAVGGVFGGRLLFRRQVTAWHTISSYVQTILQRDLRRTPDRAAPQESSIPDFVIPSFIENAGDGEPDQGVLERLPSEPFILFVGALQPHKGLGTLLEAYRRLSAPPPLVLIGTVWPDTPREFPPGVTVLSNLPHASVMAAWGRCLFGVAPSLCPEAFGGVVVEAMTAGKAVIASAIGGPTDTVVDGETGLLVPPGDVASLTRAMQELIDQPQRRQRLGQAGRERAKLFRPDAVLPRFEALYQQVVAG